jgi:hypothetical protein
MAETRAELLTRAAQIRDEFRTNANSATRVGGALYQLAASARLEPFDVTVYGAVGDGVTDDTAAIQAAATAALAAGKGVVFCPAGRYKFTSTLTFGSGVTLLGAGIGKTVLYAPAASFSNTTIGTRGATSLAIEASGLRTAPYTQASNITLRDFTLEFEVSDGRCLYGIRCDNVLNPIIDSVEIFGLPVGNLVELNSVSGGAVRRCYLHDCGTALTTYGSQPQLSGIEVDNNKINSVISVGTEFHNNHVEDVMLTGSALGTYGAQSDGINLQNGTGLRVHHNYMKNVGEGVDTFASDGAIHDNELVDCFHAGVKMIHGASRNNVHNNVITRPGRSGISLSGVTAATEYNYIHDNTIHAVNNSTEYDAISNAALHTISGGGIEANNNTFRNNKVTGGINMDYAVRNEAGTGNRYYDTEAESWLVAYSSVSGGTATIVNAKKTFVRASVGTNQDFASGVAATVDYDTEQSDTQSEWDTAAATYTANSHRLLRVYACVRITSTITDTDVLRIMHNGSPVSYRNIVTANSEIFLFEITDVLSVVPGDTISILLEVNGGTRTVSGASSQSYVTISEVAG